MYGGKKRTSPQGQLSEITDAKTPINISRLASCLMDHPDKDFVCYLLGGLRDGFYTGFKRTPTISLECKNLLSARTQPFITSQLEKRVLVWSFGIRATQFWYS